MDRRNHYFKQVELLIKFSNNRRILEILSMATNPIELVDLIETRSNLIQADNDMFDDRDKKFLVDFKGGHPDWSYFSSSHIKDLPAVK